MTMTPADLALALAAINALRAERNLPPITEIPHATSPDPRDPIGPVSECPLVYALEASMVGTREFIVGSQRRAPLPEILQAFVEDYDAGRLPQFQPVRP